MSMILEEQLDSQEEIYFLWYIKELMEFGYVDSYEFHGQSFLLCESVNILGFKTVKLKTKEKKEPYPYKLLNQHTYTPDCVIHWNEKARNIFFESIPVVINGPPPSAPFITAGGNVSYIDIKGSHSGRLSSSSTFPLNQKWMFAVHKVYVQKVIHVTTTKKGIQKVYGGLFPTTFTPERYLLSDKGGKVRTIHYKHKTLKEYAESRIQKEGLL